jgi:hypothetical protein
MVACSVNERLLRRRSSDFRPRAAAGLPSTTLRLGRPAATLRDFAIFAVFVFQKSIWALNFMKRACNTLFGRSHVSVVGTKVWLYVRTAAELVML